MADSAQQAIAPINEKGVCNYNVAGQDVRLSYQIVRDYLVKGGGKVSDQDLVQFISICKFNQLNPFLGEAYLVKYGTTPATMVVSKEALLKRADACENYEGIEAGIIVIRDGKVVELEGCFFADNDKLVGGWAKVYRSDRRYPTVAKVRLDEYDKKQSVWKEKPSTMISKVAKVQALREAFPAQLGAMYTAEEKGIKDADYLEIKDEVEQDKRDHANKKHIVIEASSATSQVVDKETGEINHDNNAARETPTDNAKVAENANNAPNPGF